MRRRACLLLGGAACLVLTWRPSPPRLMWNTTASVPIGLYQLTAPVHLRRADLAVVLPPKPLASQLAARGLLPPGVPLLKPVAADPGQIVCRRDLRLFIDDVVVARALARDRLGRPLPSWNGCRRLGPDDLFVLNPAAPGSFDGRYFGVLPRTSAIARARPIWTPKAASMPERQP